MHTHHKQALLLLRDIKAVIEDRDFLSDEEERILDEINTIFTSEQETNETFAKFLEDMYKSDYLPFEETKPAMTFDEWIVALDQDTDTRYEYFITFLQA